MRSALRQLRGELRSRHDDACGAVGEQEADPLLRVVPIDGHIGRAGLEDAHHCNHHLDGPRQVDGHHPLVRRSQAVDDPARKPVALCVEPRIGQRALARPNGDGIRRDRRLAAEAVDDRGEGGVRLGCVHRFERRPLVGGQQVDGRDRLVRIVDQRVEHQEEVPDEGIFPLVVEDVPIQVEVQRPLATCVEVVHLEAEHVVAVSVTGMNPVRSHRHAREVPKGSVDEVEQHRVRPVVGRAARSRPGVDHHVLRLGPHLLQQAAESLVFVDRDVEGHDLDEQACGGLEPLRWPIVGRCEHGELVLPRHP